MEGLQPDMSTQSLDVQQEPGDIAVAGDNIRVYVRVRPPTDREIQATQAVLVERETNSIILRGDQPRHFTFDGVLAEDASQDEVFELVGRSIGESCLAGYNGSIYVYGQTGVGKTYTMCGPVTSLQSMQFEERRGLICRILDYVFAEIYRRRARSDSVSYLCCCSFLEIYKEQIVDLLDPSSTNLQVREDVNRGIYVERLTEQTVSSLTEAFQVLWKGLQQRHVSATTMNERSSRSHAVFTLSIETSSTRAGVTSTRVARLNLVDLAGSERQISAYHSQSARVKEAGAINKSLSALTNVIMSLSRSSMSRRRNSVTSQDGADGRRPFAHYRDSKLTFLLRDSLGGNSKTAIIANVSPSMVCSAETLSTLKFAARAKHIRCVAVRNEEFSGTVESLMSEVKMLRQQLAQLSSRNLSGDVAEGLDNSALDDEAQVLYSRKRAKRLEILLAAALERERLADHKRHQLQRLAEFLQDLNFRKEQYLGKVLGNYSLLAAEIGSSKVLADSWDGDLELKKKLVGFQNLLGNLVSSNNTFACREEDEAQLDVSYSTSQLGSPAVPSGSQGPWASSASRSAARTQGGSTPAGTTEADGAVARMDEATFLIEENRRLRRQLERHMELHRLNAEHRDLRMRLAELDPGGSAWNSRLGASRGAGDLNTSLDSDDSSSGDQGSPVGADGLSKEQSAPLSAEMLLRLAEVEDDSTAIRTWIYFQKMAKEVEALLRTKECLSNVIGDLRSSYAGGKDVKGSAVQTPGQTKVSSTSPRPDKKDKENVEWQIVEDLAQCTQDAQGMAVSIVESMGNPDLGSEDEEGGPLSILPIEGMDGIEPKSARGGKGLLSSNLMGGDSARKGTNSGSRLTSSTPHLGSGPVLKLGKRSTGLLSRNKSTRGLGGVDEVHLEDDGMPGDIPAVSSGMPKDLKAASLKSAHKAQLKDALQRVKHLYGTLDILNSAYSDVYDQFQHLREEYESRLEECQFFELQCSRLDMQCQEIADRMNCPLRPGPAGHYSAAGFPNIAQLPSRRSLSLSSLRDADFWESRFRELERITGIDDAATSEIPSARLLDGAGEQPLPASSSSQPGQGTVSRRFTPLGPPVRRAAPGGVWQTPSVLTTAAPPLLTSGSTGNLCSSQCISSRSSSSVQGMGQGTRALAQSSSLSALRSEEEWARNAACRPQYQALYSETVRRVASAPLLPSSRGLASGAATHSSGGLEDANAIANRLRFHGDATTQQVSSRPLLTRPPGASATDNRTFRFVPATASVRQGGGTAVVAGSQPSSSSTSQPTTAATPTVTVRRAQVQPVGTAAQPKVTAQPAGIDIAVTGSAGPVVAADVHTPGGRVVPVVSAAAAGGKTPRGAGGATTRAPVSAVTGGGATSSAASQSTAAGTGGTASGATSRSSSRGVTRPLVVWSGASRTDRRATPQAGASGPSSRPTRRA
mmetsp:Transcript_28681/g.66536  ORF Transcript_28681/g.66536 Transcript_28681/m.66536 type:complete len:1431 (-) Transcript_28681:69-4361(-)